MARAHGKQERRRGHFQKRQRRTQTLDDADLNYAGDWTHEDSGASTLMGGTQSWTGDPDASLSFTFTGTGFDFLAGTKSDRGAFQYTVDGGSPQSGTQAGTSDQQAPKAEVVARERGLDYGSHTIIISNASQNYLGADAVVTYDDDTDEAVTASSSASSSSSRATSQEPASSTEISSTSSEVDSSTTTSPTSSSARRNDASSTSPPARSSSAVRIISSSPPLHSSHSSSDNDSPLIADNSNKDDTQSQTAAGKKAAMIGVPVAAGLVFLLAAILFFFRWRRSKKHGTDAIPPQGPTHWLDGAQNDYAQASLPYKNPVRFYGSGKSRKHLRVGSTDPMQDPFAPQPLSSPPLVNPFILAGEEPTMQQKADLPIVQIHRSNSGYSVHPNVPLEEVIDFDAHSTAADQRTSENPLQRQNSHDARLTAATEAAFDGNHRVSAASSHYEPTLPDTPRMSSDTSSPTIQQSPADGMYATLTRGSVYSNNSSSRTLSGTGGQRHVL